MNDIRRVKFRELRHALNVSQEKMAIDLGISLSQLRNIETGRSTPSPLLMFRIARYFNKPIEEVFQDIAQAAERQVITDHTGKSLVIQSGKEVKNR